MAKLRLSQSRLTRVGKAKQSQLANWREGASLERDSGLTINSLALKVAVDRWKLAAAHRRDGNKLLKMLRPPYRSAVGRFYYAMYHAMRSACYIYHDGDDHEAHRDLLLHIPDDFPNKDPWKNRLKTARLDRNAADYDPYPNNDKSWEVRARKTKKDADALLTETRIYLRAKGCVGI